MLGQAAAGKQGLHCYIAKGSRLNWASSGLNWAILPHISPFAGLSGLQGLRHLPTVGPLIA